MTRIGAVITAAGMSSRMGDFKPMLNIGSMSIAQRIVATLHQAGVEKIVIVTGYHAEELERHLSNHGVVFLRNENYETTHMFDSVKIGLEYLKDKCDKILFTPVDIPLFTASTVKALTEAEADLACPVCNGEDGHPIVLSSFLADEILKDCGERGLKGALERCSAEMLRLPVQDEGILHDADTPQEYQKLLEYHNNQLSRPVVMVELAREKSFFNPQIAMLMSLIEETESVRTACQRMQISYSTGWNKIRVLETQLGQTLVSRNQGGKGGGRSKLTPQGKMLLERYEAYVSVLKKKADEIYEDYFGDLF